MLLVILSNMFISIVMFRLEIKSIHNLFFSNSLIVLTATLQIIQTDFWGLAPMLSSNGSRYCISFVDLYGRYTWVSLIKAKSEVSSIFRVFKNMV